MISSKTALILIGYQKDYFSPNGILFDVIKDSSEDVLKNTLNLIDQLTDTPAVIISTPIFFTSDYRELTHPVGILKMIHEVGAFTKGSIGSDSIDELTPYEKRIMVLDGKRGLNAFRDTNLEAAIRNHDITDIAIAGVVTSICVDSTARSAYEGGFNVTVLSDCTAGRTQFEQDFYCNEIFPLYANVMDSKQFLDKLDRPLK